MSMAHPHHRAPIRERSQVNESVRALQVYGDVLALLDLVPIDRAEVAFDEASFVIGAMSSLICLQRPAARLPSAVLNFYNGGE